MVHLTVSLFIAFYLGAAVQPALGHTAESYSDPVFIAYLEGTILWAAGRAK